MARLLEFDEAKVLDKAVLLFWRKGYYDTSAQNLVDNLGLSRSSIYNSFKDKRTLFIYALHRYRDKESKKLFEFLNEKEPDIDTIRHLLEFVTTSSLAATNCKGCLMVNTATEIGNTDIEIQKIIQANIEDAVKTFEDFIKSGQTKGTFPSHKNARGLAIALFHSITAIRVTSKIAKDKSFFKMNIEATIQMFN